LQLKKYQNGKVDAAQETTSKEEVIEESQEPCNTLPEPHDETKNDE
jgi:hypothetical protein